MRVINKGYQYALDSFVSKNKVQSLTFVKKVPVGRSGGTALRLVHDGTTVEEVLKALIHRLKFLDAKLPDRRTCFAIDHLERALFELNTRTADRKKRGVKGTSQP